MTLLRFTTILSIAFATLTSTFAGGEGWLTDFAAAQKQAAAEKKQLLLEFTGSDWCMPCQMMKKEVFSTKEFLDAVKDKFVLVELDFPKDESKITPATKKQNNELQVKYGVQGYPSVMLCGADGTPFAVKSGYEQGGPAKFLEALAALGEKKAANDKALAEAAKGEGVAKAKALAAALKGTELPPASIANFYGSVIDDIKAADPKDEAGYFSGLSKQQKFDELQQKTGELMLAGKMKEAVQLIDAALGDLEGEQKQAMLLMKAIFLQQTYKFTAALKALDEAVALGGTDEVKQQIGQLRNMLEAGKKAFDESVKEASKGE